MVRERGVSERAREGGREGIEKARHLVGRN